MQNSVNVMVKEPTCDTNPDPGFCCKPAIYKDILLESGSNSFENNHVLCKTRKRKCKPNDY